MSQHVYVAVVVWVVTSVLGIGPYLLIAPRAWLRAPLLAVVLPCLGLVVLLVTGVWQLGLGRRVEHGALLAIALSSALAAGGWVLHRGRRWNALTTLRRTLAGRRPLAPILVATLVIAAAALPVSRVYEDELLPVRLNIDAPLYVDAAQALMTRHTLANLPTPWSSDALRVHVRWGVPLLLAQVAGWIGATHAYLVALGIAALAHGLLAGCALLMMNRCLGLRLRTAVIGGALVAFNCNLLNLVLEAQWPHAVAMPLIVLAIAAWYEQRCCAAAQCSYARDRVARTEPIPLTTARRCGRAATVATMGWLLGAVLALYSEVMPLLVAVAGAVSLADLARERLRGLRRLVPLLGGVAIALAVMAPYTRVVLPHLATLQVAGAGYPQPHWALPDEILGLDDLYRDFDRWFTPEHGSTQVSRLQPAVGIVASVFALAVTALGWWATRRRDGALWFAFPLAMAASLAAFLAFSRHNNYGYMKVYTTCLPVAVALLVAGLAHAHMIMPRVGAVFAALIALSIATSGLEYLADHRATSHPLTTDIVDVAAHLPLIDPGGRFVYITRPRGLHDDRERYRDRTEDFALIPVMQGRPLIDQWGQGPIDAAMDAALLQRPVCAMIDTRVVGDWPLLLGRGRLLFANRQWLLVDTGVTLAQFQVDVGDAAARVRAIDFAALWRGLRAPASQ